MSPNSGAWEVWLPWRPLLEGPAEMTRAGEAGACWPEGLTLGCSRTPGAFLVTRGHLMVSLQNLALPQAQTERAWGALGQRCGPFSLFHLVQRDPKPSDSAPTVMEDSPPPRFSSHPLLAGKTWSGLLGWPWLHNRACAGSGPVSKTGCLVLLTPS